jgi:WD40 repeat protein
VTTVSKVSWRTVDEGWHAVSWANEIVSIAELTGGKAPLARDGAVALDSSGDLLAVETRDGQILIAYGHGAAPGLFDVGVQPLGALALSGRAARWAAGALDGHIALHDIHSGELCTELAMETQSLTALAFSADGRLLAASDGDGHVVVYRIDSGQVVRKLETGKEIRALALHDEGFPLLAGDADGRVVLYRRALPPKELEGDQWDLSSLTCLSLTSGGALVGSARGTISKVDFGYRGISPLLNGVGPVRALGAGSSGRLRAVVSGLELELRSWDDENSLTQVIRSLPGVLSDIGEMVTGGSGNCCRW